jgi:hypothetical protein
MNTLAAVAAAGKCGGGVYQPGGGLLHQHHHQPAAGAPPSPPPASSNPENNACRLIDYRGARVAAFNVDGRQLICLPQAFELFLKHLVGGLHTVYTKLKRLDITPVVCNVEQVRVLRGLGAIQPGVNRCKLISPAEFDILYDDCTNSSARPGRPPKRSALNATPDTLDSMKKSRTMIGQMTSPGDYFSSVGHIVDGKKGASMAHLGGGGSTNNPFAPPTNSSSHHHSVNNPVGGVSSNGGAAYSHLMSFASDLHKNSPASFLGGAAGPGAVAGPTFPYPSHLAAAAAAAAAGHFAFMPLAAHPGMMNLAVATANHLGSMRAAAAAAAAATSGPSPGDHHLLPDMISSSSSSSARLRNDVSRLLTAAALAPPSAVSPGRRGCPDEFNNNARAIGAAAHHVKSLYGSFAAGPRGSAPDPEVTGLDRPLNLEMHKRGSTKDDQQQQRQQYVDRSGSTGSGTEADSCSVASGISDRPDTDCQREESGVKDQQLQQQLDLSRKSATAMTASTAANSVTAVDGRHHGSRRYMHDVVGRHKDERNSGTTDADRLSEVDDDEDDDDEDVGGDGGPDSCSDDGYDRDDRPQCINGLPVIENGGEPGGNDVVCGGGPPSCSPTMHCGGDMTSLDALFINIQGLLKMAIDRSRDREEKLGYVKATLRQKIDKERELCETFAKRLDDEQKMILTLQRRLKMERKLRRRLQLQLEQQRRTMSPSGERTTRHGFASYSAGGGSTDSEDCQQPNRDADEGVIRLGQQAQHGAGLRRSPVDLNREWMQSSGERSRSSGSDVSGSSCGGGGPAMDGAYIGGSAKIIRGSSSSSQALSQLINHHKTATAEAV